MWAYTQWHQKSNISYDTVYRSYLFRAKKDSLPKCFILLKEEKPVGMISLKQNDLASFQTSSPWLSALYVLPEHRSCGYGTMLIDYLTLFSQRSRYRELFLFTDHSQKKALTTFYQKRGWKFYGKWLDAQKRVVHVMCTTL